MYVDIPKSLLKGGITGDDVRLEGDAICLGEETNNGVDIIRVTTNLTGCGTNMTVRNMIINFQFLIYVVISQMQWSFDLLTLPL